MTAPQIPPDSYGPIAEIYATVTEPIYFAAPARELFALLRLAPSSRLLDVGCGTGALSTAAAPTLVPSGRLVVADQSLGMLAVCKQRIPTARAVACSLPCLPYSDGAFDAVTAAFVLSHLAEPGVAVAEMARVLAPAGAVGVSSWVDSAASTPPGRLWQQHLEAHVSPGEMQSFSARQLPTETVLSDPRQLARVLEVALLTVDELVVREFPILISTQEFIASRSVSLPARHARSLLGPGGWQHFLAVATDAFATAFGEHVSFVLRACLARAVVRRGYASTARPGG